MPSTTFMRLPSRESASSDNRTALSDFRYYSRRFRQRVLLIKKVIARLAELIIRGVARGMYRADRKQHQHFAVTLILAEYATSRSHLRSFHPLPLCLTPFLSWLSQPFLCTALYVRRIWRTEHLRLVMIIIRM